MKARLVLLRAEEDSEHWDWHLEWIGEPRNAQEAGEALKAAAQLADELLTTYIGDDAWPAVQISLWCDLYARPLSDAPDSGWTDYRLHFGGVGLRFICDLAHVHELRRRLEAVWPKVFGEPVEIEIDDRPFINETAELGRYWLESRHDRAASGA